MTVVLGNKWEDVVKEDHDGIPCSVTQRMPVENGWLYKVMEYYENGESLAMCFVPDVDNS